MMRMSSSLLLLWTILIVPSRDQLVMSTFLEHTSILPVQLNDDKECPLECQNGGSCKTRAAGSSAMNIRETLHVEEGDHIDDMDDHDQWECVCPPGHAGKLCQLRPREERDLAQTECGSLVCENGGTCMKGHNVEFEGKPVCDCSRAWEIAGTKDDESFQRYVGKTCQILVTDDDYCPGRADPEDKHYCLNGGQCRGKAKDFDRKPCKCFDGFRGRHCEYSPEDVEKCDLTCNGVGECEHGANPFSDNGANGILDLHNNGVNKYMYCRCDEDYAGTNCEYQYAKCGKGRFCYHGSTCDDSGDEIQCSCENAIGELVLGDSCEFKATDNCANPKEPTRDADEDFAIMFDELPFCVNNGLCVQFPDGNLDEYYCECDEDEWTGRRCETRVVNLDDTPAPSPEGTDTYQPTIMASVTELPTESDTTDMPTESDTTDMPSEQEPEPQDPVRNKGNNGTLYDDDNEMSGFAKFAISLVTFVFVFTLTMVFYRQYKRVLFRKENDIASKNLQLDMISEENNADGMTSVSLSHDDPSPVAATDEQDGKPKNFV